MDNIDNLSEIIQQTEEYKQICDQCKDEILIYPTISNRTNYTQEEVEAKTLRVILRRCKEVNKFKQALDTIEEFVNRTCDACKEFTPDRQSGINCRYCNRKQILNIIKSTKN